MPNRILKESICTSETIDALSIEAEAFFYRLMVQCDDFGRMDARSSVLRARCYPLRLDKVTDKAVGRWLKELADAELLWVYRIDGRDYLQVTTWDKHQQKRAKYSKYPQPDINGNQLISDASNSPREARSENTRSDDAGASAPPSEDDPKQAEQLPAVKVYLDNGGTFPSGKLTDGTPRSERAKAFIAEHVTPTPDSLTLWGRVVAAYQMQWSPKSYTVMVNDYYLRGRVPGEAATNGNGHAAPSHKTVYKDYS